MYSYANSEADALITSMYVATQFLKVGNYDDANYLLVWV